MSETTSQDGPSSRENQLVIEGLTADRASSEPEADTPDFDFQKELQGLKGPFIEIGGPTDEYFTKDAFPNGSFQSEDNLLVGNIEEGRTIGKKNPDGTFTEEFLKYDLDFRADGLALPFANDSLGAVFSSNLPRNNPVDTQNTSLGEKEFRGPFMLEAKRALEPGGLMIMQSISEADIRFAEEHGLEIAYRDGASEFGPDPSNANVIFRKPIEVN